MAPVLTSATDQLGVLQVPIGLWLGARGGDNVISEDLNIYQSLIPDLLQNCMDKTSDVK